MNTVFDGEATDPGNQMAMPPMRTLCALGQKSWNSVQYPLTTGQHLGCVVRSVRVTLLGSDIVKLGAGCCEADCRPIS